MFAAAVVALFGAGPPAAADDGWERIPCFSGAIERAEITAGDYVTLTGHLDCGVPENSTGPRWGYAAFIAGLPYGTLNDADLQTYSHGDRTAFSDRMRVDRLPELGICVVTDYEVRIACVKVTRKSPTSPMLVGPTDVDDELVDRPLERRSEGAPNPVCGHC
ncbi:hypothetical protein ACN28C_26805 [Plantactinospora sp. WMMC1484]|uniref:hypothetical protein n=1 Tax=Plantactinospora sp. WMMC1484 TaxID=3404122 RepID=UPI003BF607D6